jgi:hypothetical protein
VRAFDRKAPGRDPIIAHQISRRPYHPKRRPAQVERHQDRPRGLASVAAAVVRALAEAQARLAKIRSSRL